MVTFDRRLRRLRARRAHLLDGRRERHGRVLAGERAARGPRHGTRATARRNGVPLLGGEWGRSDTHRQDVLRGRRRVLGRARACRRVARRRCDVRRQPVACDQPCRRLRGSRPDERRRMSPAAPTRPDAITHATDEPTAPPLQTEASEAESDAATPARAGTPQNPQRAAEVAAVFDELAPVHDRLATILSLGLDRRWRSAVVEETRLTAGDSAIDVAAGTGQLATELADRVGPFGRIVAVDLSEAMVDRGTARARDIVQLEFVVGDALQL